MWLAELLRGCLNQTLCDAILFEEIKIIMLLVERVMIKKMNNGKV
ncbi:hypothetical protein XCR1_4210023 [Xenorhabdus cabanillasii JM26]|uniref:Uncharacterized protein n=1 Tax=Xenorhabdus cabanillasii JM26 TaxID=1427517 RepID=W1JAP0_9GAMM|nr:hypothetical protein XCR1_4210023 [Xenorhabdus cabanillasii JM26]